MALAKKTGSVLVLAAALVITGMVLTPPRRERSRNADDHRRP